MSDSKLRELERRWRETRSVEDEAAYLRERVRVGDLTQERLELAAYCGHEGARRATSADLPEPAAHHIRLALETARTELELGGVKGKAALAGALARMGQQLMLFVPAHDRATLCASRILHWVGPGREDPPPEGILSCADEMYQVLCTKEDLSSQSKLVWQFVSQIPYLVDRRMPNDHYVRNSINILSRLKFAPGEIVKCVAALGSSMWAAILTPASTHDQQWPALPS